MFIRVRDIDIHVQQEGPAQAPPVVLLHSLGTNAHIWDDQARELARNHHVIRPDLRGHGLTSCTPGPYSMELFVDDLLGLLEALGLRQIHLGGISIGGLIAQAFAAAHPQRLASLILIDTAMAFPPPQSWTERAALVRAQGLIAIADAVISRWVTPDFSATPTTAGLRAMLLRTPVEGYAAAAEALATADLTHATATLQIPTLVIVGAQDPSTPIATAQALHAAITGSSLCIVPGAAHIPLVEKPEEITAAMLNFLNPPITDYAAAGMAVRTQVLGAAHVARAARNTTDLDRDFQAFITRTAWGGVWARPGLERRTRSLLTITMMASLGHEEELKLHLRASQNTGVTQADITEVLMQVAVYAGVPAANSAFRIAKEVFAETQP